MSSSILLLVSLSLRPCLKTRSLSENLRKRALIVRLPFPLSYSLACLTGVMDSMELAVLSVLNSREGYFQESQQEHPPCPDLD